MSRVVRTGPNTNMMALLRHFPRKGIRPEVLALDSESEEGMLRELDELEVPVINVMGGRAAARRRHLRDTITERGYSSVLSCGVRGDLFSLLCCPPGLRGVIKHEAAFTPHGGRLKTFAVRSLHLALIARADRIVSVSQYVHDSLPSLVRKRSMVIGNGVDVAHFRPPSSVERAAARKALGIPNDQQALVFAGRLIGLKRPQVVLPALQALNQRGRRVTFVVAGDGPMRAQLEAAGLGHSVKIIGFKEDIRSVFWAGDAFVLPSTHEGRPLTALEAMACGLPLLLSDIPSHTEILAGAPDAGEVVDVTDPRHLEAALARVLDLAGSPGPRHLAEAQFSASAMAAAYHDLLSSWPQ